jgi:flavin reductase (DIM6/NTAB) family NADH-FMN oxidoreductase RutF
MTMSWQTMMEFTPPLIGCVISELNYSFEALRKTGECVIAIPTAEIAPKVVRVGNTSGKKTDKFPAIGLTPVPASRVKAPLIGECFANIECRVVDTALVKKYDFFVLEAVKAWIDPAQNDPRTIHHRGKGVFAVDGKVIRILSKMK